MNVKKMEVKNIDSYEFFELLEELKNDKSDFYNNKVSLLEAYKKNTLYGLYLIETDEIYNSDIRFSNIFIKNSLYMFPCFCIVENETCIVIWVHSRARNNGFARKMIELLNIKKAFNILKESKGFWEKINIELVEK